MEVSTKSPIFVDRVDKRIVASTKSAYLWTKQEDWTNLEDWDGYKKNELHHSREAPHLTT